MKQKAQSSPYFANSTPTPTAAAIQLQTTPPAQLFLSPATLISTTPLPSNKTSIIIGNTHKQIDEHNHAWKVFVRGSNLEQIDHVRFDLHPTFQPSAVTVNCAPFEVDRVGWGLFAINITIFFKPELSRNELALIHDLDFTRDESFKEYFI